MISEYDDDKDDFECDVDDDRDCRCNKRGSECCDASRNCKRKVNAQIKFGI